MTTAEPAVHGAAGPAYFPLPGAVGQRALRDVLGRYATGVAVVTTRHRGRPAGVTVNSFASVSLEPPLVLWCLNSASASRAAFTGAGHFAVNVLAAGQRDLAARFTRPGDRFSGLPLHTGPHGLPLLPGAVAVLLCRRAEVMSAGDHLLLLGAVTDHGSAPGPALLFADGAYHDGPGPNPAQAGPDRPGSDRPRQDAGRGGSDGGSLAGEVSSVASASEIALSS
ncbi:flavin reductase family protein [Streptomyces sp. NBC_01477]|uniref:flavin reductase family protein n=1 Tax=Streptomyces sp. NBC_01477 TaxID=2976015 RepID=UPI002E31B125|nr:flavin reductase family protein [Streptomyces sp. NBC_01477]